ncbi:MAG: aspartate aminotransferase family protein [Gammaproteobacteria bacterium]|nr:aminotransferase class I/II-fold pyridoxal phosphate-dependent enzyme [Gammaproteobacteria bacterium]MBU6510126.1 aminotransferase class I/II-fold pyridoxal phosphate-dependent enzyme [Gammaproteobacteria bacterium]MDE1983938.1 aspartate aminotransferase family protein [Gammaproteobacteria bacterium]MDE2108139.1 aspartate aminotransferase family protein [Gammaproteobacteria bacterium]MDE2461894.1 aspartate aminotransferase family protein [Gammaproteobacteria bacterium]
MFQRDDLQYLDAALATLEEGFRSLPAFKIAVDGERLRAVLQETALKLQDNFPYPHPLYVGQMLKPPHPVARLAYMLALYLNPNNHALDGGRASSAMEKQAVAEIARLFGYQTHLGHLCASGTIANLEALWIARHARPPGVMLASEQAHYTHARMCEVLGMPFETISADATARMDLNALEDRLRRGSVATVVATLGTTATGAVDPLPAILQLRERYGFRLHVDAAYGGYFILADNLEGETRAAFDAMQHADSIVVDPHKHGLQPYGCGCVLLRDPGEGRHYKHDSPYTYFTSGELHLGEISLECSRAGAAAVALWATQRLLPMERGGEFARGLEAGREASLALHRHLQADSAYLAGPRPELDIVVWSLATKSRSEASRRAQAVFDAAAQRNLHLALLRVPDALAKNWWPELAADAASVTALRSCLMKPEHKDWLPRITEILDTAAHAVLGA